ncbi:hypothetical protein BD626DRAFT_540240 [Schizophyllum amplum]|uniref:Uncharacterized protein n=1 Tax=Schizophyllum amplum TaxID=97359 RepID=A0A550BZP7_9AGAR|nr:hypothetical protein BD626DRAFT_540240 [Auriculariopsis ampla]
MSRFLPSLAFTVSPSHLPRVTASNGAFLFFVLTIYVLVVCLAYARHSRHAFLKMVKQHGTRHQKRPAQNTAAPRPRRYERALSVADRSIVLRRFPPPKGKMRRDDQARVRYAHKKGLSRPFLALMFSTNAKSINNIIDCRYDRHNIISPAVMRQQDRQRCDNDFKLMVKQEVQLQRRETTAGHRIGDRHGSGSWRAPSSGSQSASAPAEMQHPTSASQRLRAGPSTSSRTALKKRAASVSSTDDSDDAQDSEYEPEAKFSNAADSDDDSDAEMDDLEDSKEDVKTVRETLFATNNHAIITVDWILAEADLADRGAIVQQMADAGVTDKHAVMLARMLDDELKTTIRAIFPAKIFGSDYDFALCMLEKACQKARTMIDD